MKPDLRPLAGAMTVFACALLLMGVSRAQAPAEIQNVEITGAGELTWDAQAGADHYHVYQSWSGGQSGLAGLRCAAFAETGTLLPLADPEPGQIVGYVVTGESLADGEGTAGSSSSAVPRYLEGACGTLMRTHLMDRAGFGWNEWSADRIANLGSLEAYLDEQLNPSSISEDSNFQMSNKLSQYSPPLDGLDLIARHVILGIYSWRQLEHKMGTFWWNHFNTEWGKVAGFYLDRFPDCRVSSDPACDGIYPFQGHLEASGAQLRDYEKFSDLAFNGNFREMLEAGTLSPAMLVYLDLYISEAVNPNENQPRELLELHSMSDNGSYTQTDVEELTRILTGWGICMKSLANADDPLAACIPDYWQQAGQWTANFDITRHDCTPKTLFAGTPYETFFPGTASCSSAADATAAMAEFAQALDLVASHPSTKRFISMKMLQLLVTDAPSEAQIDEMVLVWDDATNPNGVGDLRELTRKALELGMDPAMVNTKIKTPYEQFVTAMRTLHANSNGTDQILVALTETQHLPFFNEVPTGFAEVGGDWIATGGVQSRQSFGLTLASSTPSLTFGCNPVTLLNNQGISTSGGNEAEIVDFFSEILFGGALTMKERQAAIQYLSTDFSGNPSPYTDGRIRNLVGVLLGFPQFMEQ